MKFEKFEEIIAWRKSRILCNFVYVCFRGLSDFGFRDQIQRASVSVMNNVAEGFERSSNADFKRFLFMAKASSAEVRSMFYLALDLKYIDEKNFKKGISLSQEISAIISGLIKKL